WRGRAPGRAPGGGQDPPAPQPKPHQVRSRDTSLCQHQCHARVPKLAKGAVTPRGPALTPCPRHPQSPPARRGHHSHEETPAEPGHSGQPRGPESRWEPGGSGGGWGPRAGRVAGLYPQLLRELEVQELQQALAAWDEVVLHRDRWIRQLELENRQLRSQVRSLEGNDLLSSGGGRGGPLATSATTTGTLLASGTSCIGISDSNIQFLKGLVGLLESNATVQAGGLQPFAPSPGEQGCALADVPRSPPAWRLWAGLPSGFPPLPGHQGGGWQPRCAHRYCLPLGGERGGHADGTPLWASPIEENGRPKLELVPNSGVYITHLQLDNDSQVSTDKPKLMTRRLLDYFWRETLARSSATGQHIAHNATMERPLRLPMAMVNTIKEHGTKLCGHGCNFNAVINSKCGRSWWAVRKVVVE
ncbi:uncharacterized protein LOC121098873, partial [Falco naumanni]|uniref:uncharacterized protein LOC121098873 n=1 Tax=Falco naumanni TaxID=148594 RepID=UPI001ADE0DDB